MSPFLLAGMGVVGGYAGYKVLKGEPVLGSTANPNNPPPKPPAPFWSDWFQQGDMPQTGNGPPTTDQTAHDWAQGITAVTKFGTSLIEFFGAQKSHGDNGNGTSTGGPVETYGQYNA